MTRTTLLLGIAAFGAVAVMGGVFALTRGGRRARTDCRVHVYFRTDASRSQIRAVGDRVAAIDDVSNRFISRAEALEIMRRRHPELVRGLPSNPLPASDDARTTYADSCSELRAALRPRPAGVDKVSSTARPFERSSR